MKQDGGPRTPNESEELRSWAESLAPMYEKDKELLAEVEAAMKLRKMVESE